MNYISKLRTRHNHVMEIPMRIAISGGGRTGHLYTVLFKQVPDTEIFWHSRQAVEIIGNMPASGIDLISAASTEAVIATARPDFVSDDIASVVSDADVVIFTQQNEGLPPSVRAAAKHFNKKKATYVGAIPALGNAFDWLVQREVQDNENVHVWGLRGVPATSPTMSLGKSVTLGGYKEKLYLGFSDNTNEYHRQKISDILDVLFPQPKILLNSFLEMTLSPASLHPAVLYGIMGPYSQWDGLPLKQRPRWWADLSELSAYFLQKCDEEIQALIHALEHRLVIKMPNAGTLHGKQVDQYNSTIGNPRTLLTTFRSRPCRPEASILANLKNEPRTCVVDLIGLRLACAGKCSINRHPRHLQIARDLGLCRAGSNSASNFVVVDTFSAAFVNAFGLCCHDAGALPVLDELQFHIGDHAENGDHHPAHASRCRYLRFENTQ